MHQSRRWAPLVTGVIAFLVTTVVLGGLVADWTLRNQEMDAFVTAVEESEAQMTWAQTNVSLVFDEAEDPAQAADTEAVAAELRGIGAEGRDRIKAAGEQVAAVRISPWHQDLLAARLAYLKHNRAWQAYLDRASRDAAEFALPQDEVNSSFLAAEPLFRAALPPFDGYSLSERVDLIFAEPEPDSGPDSGPTQEALLPARGPDLLGQNN